MKLPRKNKRNTVSVLFRRSGNTVLRMLEFARKNPFDPSHSNTKGHKFTAFGIAVAISFALFIGLKQSRFLDSSEAQLYDWRANVLADNSERDKDIVIIAIDEQSLSELSNRWAYPWPRMVYNSLMRYCEEAGAQAVVFDILFSESAWNTNDTSDIKNDPSRAWDDLFAAEAVRHDNVVMAAILSSSERSADLASHREEYLAEYTAHLKDPEELLKLRGSDFADIVMPLEQLVSGKLSFTNQLSIEENGEYRLVNYEDFTPEQKAAATKRGNKILRKINASLEGDFRYRDMLPGGYAAQGVAGIGSVDAFPDKTDGVYRSYALAVEYDGKVIPSLALEALRVAGRTPRRAGFTVEGSGNNLLWQVDETQIPCTAQGDLLLKFHGRLPSDEVFGIQELTNDERHEAFPKGSAPYTYPRIPASVIIRDWNQLRIRKLWESSPEFRAQHEQARADKQRLIDQAEGDPERLAMIGEPLPETPFQPYLLGDPEKVLGDKIVLIAGTAAGLHDIRANPVSRVANGVELHATAIDNIRNSDFLVPIERSAPFLVDLQALLLLVGVSAAVIFSATYWLGLLALVGSAAVCLGISLASYQWGNLVWPIVTPASSGSLAFVCAGVLKFFTLGAHTRQLRGLSEQYMGRELVDYVIGHPESFKLGGEKREMTIYFSDIAGFTTISEKLDAEKLTGLLNIYLSAMTDIVLENGGIIDKYIGDAIMAIWGAPKRNDEHAVNTCRAALAMRTRLHAMQRKLHEFAPELPKDEYGDVLAIRAGINTGEVTAGNLGSRTRFSYSVIGDAVNQAARYESANKQYGTGIMIGARTEEMIRGEFTIRPLDLIVVKGKTEPLPVFELVGDHDVPEDILTMLKSYNEGYRLYHERQFEQARERFAESAKLEIHTNHSPSLVYLKRCEDYIITPPPPEWDGVFVMKTK